MIGAVILNYNTWEIAKKLAQKLEEMQTINKIVIIDNCSTDNSFFELKQIERDKISVILSSANKGYAAGNNLGIKYLMQEKISCDYIFVINPDILIDEDCFIEIINVFLNNPEYSILGGQRTDAKGRFTQRQYWCLPTFKTELLECFAVCRYCQKKNQTYMLPNQKDEVLEVEVAPGCFFGAKSSVLKDINYLDEGTFLYYEENILSKKVHDAGYKVGLATKAKYIHNHVAKNPKCVKDAFAPYLNTRKSRVYYQNTYMNISPIKRILLRIFMRIEDTEMLFSSIRNVLNNNRRKQ